MRVTMVLTELPTTSLVGAPIGEIRDAHERNLKLRLNAKEAASFTIPFDNLMAKAILSREGDVCLKVYLDSTLRFYGPCLQVEVVGDGDDASVACNFVSLHWLLEHRLAGKSAAGVSFNADRSQILRNLIETSNGSWDTGIRTGSLTTTPTVPVATDDPWRFKPISEAISELVSLMLPAYVARASLSGRSAAPENPNTDEIGNVWTNFGDSDIYAAGAYLGRRNSISDTALVVGQPSSAVGRAAISGHANATDVTVGVDYRSTTTAAEPTVHGLIARYVNASNFCVAWSQDDAATVAVAKVVGGIWTNIAIPSPGLPPINSWNSQQLAIDAAGNYSFYRYVRGSDIGTPVASGTDSALATAGALATGKTGFFDGNAGTNTLQSRDYDNFFAIDPFGVPLGLDYELAPSEPTADTGQSGVVGAGVKIATLNTYVPKGQSRPHVVFEYGTGMRSSSSFNFKLIRDNLLTQGYSLPLGFPDETDVRSYPDDPTWPATLARGLYEEIIPSDVVGGDARRGLLIRHVGVRQTARKDITFETSPNNSYAFGTDYDIGDTVTARAKVSGTSVFNGTVRVYGVDIDIDDQANSIKVTPILRSES